MNPMIFTIIAWERQAETRRAALSDKPQAGLPVKPNQPPAIREQKTPAEFQAAADACPCAQAG